MSGILVRFVILVGARPWRDLIAMQRNRWPSNSTCFFGRPLTCLALLTGLSVNFFHTNLIHLGLSYSPVFQCLSASFNNGQFVIIALSLFLAVGNKAGVASHF